MNSVLWVVGYLVVGLASGVIWKINVDRRFPGLNGEVDPIVVLVVLLWPVFALLFAPVILVNVISSVLQKEN